MTKTEISIYESKEIRKTYHNDEWWFVVEDIVLALIYSTDVKQYIKRMKQRDAELKKGWVQIVHTLPVETSGGKQRMNCANLEGIFRIIQSIPSPKAEPFKKWLAKVGYDRVQEVDNPELATKRTKELYKAKGYPDEWIEKRMRGIAVREELTDEWNIRGVSRSIEYAILTNEIMKGAFELTVDEYKNYKGLDRQNLRDHMDDLELILTMLAEATTTKFTRERNSRNFPKLKEDARDGGNVAGRTRKDIESQIGEKVVSNKNYLPETKRKKLKS